VENRDENSFVYPRGGGKERLRNSIHLLYGEKY